MTRRRGWVVFTLTSAAAVALTACTATGGDGPVSDAGEPAEEIGDGGVWEARAPLSAGSRQETAVVVLNEEMFVLGGFRGFTSVADVEAYDPTTDSWRSVASLPVPMHHAQAAVHDGRIRVLGFLSGLSFTADGRGYVFDPADESWTEVAPLPAGTERGGGIAAVVDGMIYVVGGVRGGDAVDEVHRYDPEVDTFTAVAPLPLARDHLVGGVIDGTIYAVGGRLGRIASHAPQVFAYSVATDTWSERAAMPTSRAGAAGAVVDGKLYVVGGEGNPADPSGVFPQCEAYDPLTDAWERLTPMRTPRHGMGAAGIAGKLYVPGGADVEGLASIDVHEAFSP